jgi:hypothetical protein
VILSYNGYAFAQDECTVSIDRQRVYGESGAAIDHDLERWTIEGEIIDNTATPATLIAAWRRMEAAFATDGGDLKLTYNTGTIAHELRSANTYNGVRIIQPPHYPRGDGQEFFNSRTYRIVIEAEVKPTGDQTEILYFEESLTIEGGGREIAIVPVFRGPVKIQTLYQQTEQLAMQEGVIVGRTRYPAVPPPIFPGLEWRRRRRVRKTSPEVSNLRPLTYRTFRIEYGYTFLSPGTIDGEPHRQIS